MNKNELHEVIKEIANIQLTALRKLRDDPSQVDYEDLVRLFPDSDMYILSSLNDRIAFWETVIMNPKWIEVIDHYQIGVCTHILFTMEDEWVPKYFEGVDQAWELFNDLYKRYHPELQKIWTLNNLSNISMN